MDSLTVALSADVSLRSARPQSCVGLLLVHRRAKTMLPAPFYTEVPPDLGDDETWGHQIVGGCCVDQLMYPANLCLHAAAGDKLASRVFTAFSLVRRMVAPWNPKR